MEEKFIKARSLARALKSTYWNTFNRDPNILGAGFGRRIAHGKITEDPAWVIYVARKIPTATIPPSRFLPRRLFVGGDSVEVDVVETGPFYPLAFTARERPAPSGISIGHPAPPASAGTLGCLVRDNTDGTLCILSNNHVIANQNAAAIGDAIIQPGAYDGGSSSADDIATLKRFVTINPTGNTVDGAIAEVIKAAYVVDQMKDNLMPVPSPAHPAVGLLFAGSCNRTIMNPIADVLNQLNIQFPAGPGSIAAAEVDVNLEKVGRTTEYTTSTVKEIDVTVTIDYDFGPATFDNQIATAWMSDSGDSGSVCCRGGEGGDEDHCGCGTTTAAEQVLGVKLGTEEAAAKEVRDKYLRPTLIGNFAVDFFYLNEPHLLERVRSTRISDADLEFARKLTAKYMDQARSVLAQPERSDIRVTEQHLRDARTALKRAQRYMATDEIRAAEQLFALARRTRGKNARQVMAMLNDERLFRQVRRILSRVRTIKFT